MLKFKIFFFLIGVKNIFAPSICEKSKTGFHVSDKKYRIEKAGALPDSVCESSGLEIAGENFITHGDGACPSKLFYFNKNGQVHSSKDLSIQNKDWEDITKDKSGNLYIGDFGNNNNKRKDLKIYKLSPDGKVIDVIEFHYSDQNAFPPSKKKMNFDCEAMFWFRDSLYLFSKNRGDKTVRVYSLPDKGGKYQAGIAGSFYLNSMITAADISPGNNTVALLSYGKVYFFTVDSTAAGLKVNPDFSKRINKGQTEALVFINEEDLLISNERGKLYLLKPKNLNRP
jgi:hypothetical protein